jgi:hypothetical protein
MSTRFVMLLVGTTMALTMLAAVGVAWAQSTPPPPDDTWNTNGIIYSVIKDGNYVYVGGKFTRVQHKPTGQGFPANNVARFYEDESGMLVGDRNWRPNVSAADATTTRVYALAAAGGKIWIGGKFDAVDGLARRNLAAVSAATGEVDPVVDPVVGSETNKGIRALLASETKVYVGGFFTKIDGKGRQHLGALDLSGEVDKSWKPKTDGLVHGLAFSCDKSAVFAGGKFRNAAGSDGVLPGSPRETLARFGADDGLLSPWAIPSGTVPNEEIGADLAVACTNGLDRQITAGYLGRNYVRSFHLDTGDTGTVAWENRAAGDVQAVAMRGEDKLIIGGHFSKVYDVSNPKGITRTRIAQLNLADGSVDPAWNHTVDGTSTQGVMGPWDLLVDENRLYVGGSFTLVDGVPRTQFARFTFAP